MPAVRPAHTASLLALAIAAAVLPSSAGAGDRDEYAILHRCALDACFVSFRLSDSDGDGVSDKDEEAAGTDAYDPNGTPKLPKLLDMIALDRLPSFQEGRAVLVLLPTLAPNGLPILGGLPALPGRTNTLQGLGIRPEHLAGVDLRNGLAIVRGSGASSNGKPPMRVGGIDMAWISAGGAGATLPGTMRQSLQHSPNHGGYLVDITNGGLPDVTGKPWGTSRLEYDDGKVDEISWNSGPGWSSSTINSYDSSGHKLGDSKASTKTEVAGDGTRTVTERLSWSDVRTGDVRERITTETTSPDGKMAFKETNSNSVVHGTGGTTTTTNGSGTDYYEDGKFVEGHTTTVTTTCKGDECKASVNETNGSATPITPTVCEASKDSCSVGGGVAAYVAADDTSYDPTADLRRMGFTPAATVNTALAVAGGNITFIDTPLDEIGDELPPSSTPEGPLVIYVDDDPASNTGINVFMGVGDPRTSNIPMPRIDPRLPDPSRDGNGGGAQRRLQAPGRMLSKGRKR